MGININAVAVNCFDWLFQIADKRNIDADIFQRCACLQSDDKIMAGAEENHRSEKSVLSRVLSLRSGVKT